MRSYPDVIVAIDWSFVVNAIGALGSVSIVVGAARWCHRHLRERQRRHRARNCPQDFYYRSAEISHRILKSYEEYETRRTFDIVSLRDDLGQVDSQFYKPGRANDVRVEGDAQLLNSDPADNVLPEWEKFIVKFSPPLKRGEGKMFTVVGYVRYLDGTRMPYTRWRTEVGSTVSKCVLFSQNRCPSECGSSDDQRKVENSNHVNLPLTLIRMRCVTLSIRLSRMCGMRSRGHCSVSCRQPAEGDPSYRKEHSPAPAG